MKGCKKLSEEEVGLIKENLDLRERLIFVIGVRCGFRIGEIISLRVCDVADKEEIYLKKVHTKGKLEGRVVPLHQEVKALIKQYIGESQNSSIALLFDINKSTYHRNLKRACHRAGLSSDRISSHAARKTFAQTVYNITGGDIWKIQKAMGHKSINSTAQYIDVDMDKVWKAIKGE